MIELSKALDDFSRLFESLGVDYAVMGGIAVRAHGIPRPTQDIDFTAAIDRNRLAEVYGAARRLGYTIPAEFSSDRFDQVAGMPLVRIRRYAEGKGVDVDVFLAESPFQHELLGRARIEQVDDLPIRVVTAEDLILLKLLAHRHPDFLHSEFALHRRPRERLDSARILEPHQLDPMAGGEPVKR